MHTQSMIRLFKDVSLIFAERNRRRVLFCVAGLILAVAFLDWRTPPDIVFGFLYLIPIVLAAGFLSRVQIVVLAVFCSVLILVLGAAPRQEAEVTFLFSSLGFAATGLLVFELLLKQRSDLQRHLGELRQQIRLRQDAEDQLRLLIETNPAAIVTVAPSGEIVQVNNASQHLLAPDGPPLLGQNISTYLPALASVLKSSPAKPLRTVLQGRGQRANGETFLASAWFSTYMTTAGPRLTAVIVDLSEDLCNREDLSLNYFLKSMRILMGAFGHEIRNLCGAALVVHKNLSHVRDLEHNADFRALAAVIQNLQRLASMELGTPQSQVADGVDLSSVLDELRVLIGAAGRTAGIEVLWQIEDGLPMIWADRYALLQVFLNLTDNSCRAMQGAQKKQLRVIASEVGEHVVVRFEDTGCGIQHPEDLFRPLQSRAQSSGLGLFVSRALVNSFGGDLRYEPLSQGCCFSVVLPLAHEPEEVAHG